MICMVSKALVRGAEHTRGILRRVFQTLGGLAVEFDDEVGVHVERDLVLGREGRDLGVEFRWVERDPAWDLVAAHGFHVLADDLLDLRLHGDHITDIETTRWDVTLVTVDEDMAVADELTRGPDGADHPSTADNIVQATLEELHEDITRVALLALRFFNSAAELLLENVVVVAELLLLDQADAVVTQTATTEAVHTRRGELAL